MTVNPATHMRNEFFHFCGHESTQICKYGQGLLSKNTINRKNKRRKMFPLLMEMLTLLFLISFYLPSQDQFHWLLLVGVTVRLPQSDVNDGFSMTFQ